MGGSCRNRRRNASEAFSEWERFVDERLARVPGARDERPFFVRRYWRAQDEAAAAPAPRLPRARP
jgi:hypothetical protein